MSNLAKNSPLTRFDSQKFRKPMLIRRLETYKRSLSAQNQYFYAIMRPFRGKFMATKANFLTFRIRWEEDWMQRKATLAFGTQAYDWQIHALAPPRPIRHTDCGDRQVTL